MRGLASYALMVWLASCISAFGLDLSFRSPAREVFHKKEDFVSYRLPVDAVTDGKLPTIAAEGPMDRHVWQLELSGSNTLAITDNLRRQLEAVGFETLFECETTLCGGFDFRFQTEIVAEPFMHVDLGDFHFLSLQRLGGAIPEYIGLMVSRNIDTGFVQVTRIGGASDLKIENQAGATRPKAPAVKPEKPSLPPAKPGSVAERLLQDGFVVLTDLDFQTGSSALGDHEFASLKALAGFLKSAPDRKIVLVGHTDASGSLDGNIALSRKRAGSVAKRLIEQWGVSSAQVSSEGVGYLSPVTSNETKEGRELNRRVEVVLLPNL